MIEVCGWGGFTDGLGNCTAFEAELWGVWSGIMLARRFNCRKIIVETDSTSVACLPSK